MARRSRWEIIEERQEKERRKQPMGAVTLGEFEALQEAAKKLFRRVLASKATFLTIDDLMEMFIKPEHYELAKLAPQLVEECDTACGLVHSINGLRVGFGFDASFASLKYLGQYANTDTPGYHKLQEWVQWRIETGRKWGLVNATLGELCVRCADLRTIRFLWPAVITLCAYAVTGSTRLDPDKLRDFKVPSELPLVPPELKEAMAETFETVTVSLLLPENALEQFVSLNADERSLPDFHTPWGTSCKSF